jgi:hypothetical protein
VHDVVVLVEQTATPAELRLQFVQPGKTAVHAEQMPTALR